jgi:hypothetical protein
MAMNSVERIAAGVGLVVVVFGAGAAWNSLSDRIDKVDDKITAIQKTLGSTTCNAILSREMEAIDKNKATVRKALDGLSQQYGCGPHDAVVVVPDFGQENAAAMSSNTTAYDTRELKAQLNAVDAQLNKKD